MSGTRNVVHIILMLLLSVQLRLSTTVHWAALAEESEEGFSFVLDFMNAQHQRESKDSTDVFHFFLPAGVSCEANSAESVVPQQQPAAAVNIPVQISFPALLLEQQSFSARQFYLQVAYVSDRRPEPEYVDLEFNLEDAGMMEEQPGRAALNATASLQMPCAQYLARFRVYMVDRADAVAVALSFGDDVEIIVAASSHKLDFCYLVQAPSFFDTSHLTEANASIAVVLQWKTLQPQPHSIFLPNSTWNQGRNALLAAVRRHQCRYYIFVDEDAELVHREWDVDGASMSKPERLGDTWREFERLLLAWKPAVAVPHAQWHSTNTSSKSVAETIALYDHMVLALSSSAVDCMMPYEVRWDEDSLDYSVIPSYIIGHLLFPNQVLQFKSLSAINKDSRNWPRDILSFMRPLMWTLGAMRPNPRFFDLFSAWFYRHPGLSNYRPSMTKSLEEPTARSANVETHTCNVKLAAINLCHPLWQQRNLTLLAPTNGTAVRCYGDFDSAAAANEVILGMMIALYGSVQAVCADSDCAGVMRDAMHKMSSAMHSAWSV